MTDTHQAGAGVRFEWGLHGALAICDERSVAVVVDVLSFSTAVAVATGRGTAVYPHPVSGDAEAFAAAHHASCAVRRAEVDATHPWSLSPTHLVAAPAVGRLVLPSPNGSAIAASVKAEAEAVVAGCLRNAAAVGRWLGRHGYGTPERPVAVVAAGERWPDGALRPALEDLLGAGAIIAALEPGAVRSPEAACAEAAWSASRDDVGAAMLGCASGQELATAGHAGDVELAARCDADTTVPLLVDGAFRATES